jgi:acyl-coenzyme A synthetase/AMP-(fatty) acid ligase
MEEKSFLQEKNDAKMNAYQFIKAARIEKGAQDVPWLDYFGNVFKEKDVEEEVAKLAGAMNVHCKDEKYIAIFGGDFFAELFIFFATIDSGRILYPSQVDTPIEAVVKGWKENDVRTIFCLDTAYEKIKPYTDKGDYQVIPVSHSDYVDNIDGFPERLKKYVDVPKSEELKKFLLGTEPQVGHKYNDIVTVMSTGGTTTGYPKEIDLTQERLRFMSEAYINSGFPVFPGSRVMSDQILPHMTGLFGELIGPLLLGAVIVSQIFHISDTQLLDDFRDTRPQVSFTTPVLLRGMVERRDEIIDGEFSDMTVITVGGAKSFQSTMEKFENEIRKPAGIKAPCLVIYGSSECSSTMLNLPEKYELFAPSAGVEVRLVDEDGAILEDIGAIGYLESYSLHNATKYTNVSEDINRTTFKTDSEGRVWVCLGDMFEKVGDNIYRCLGRDDKLVAFTKNGVRFRAYDVDSFLMSMNEVQEAQTVAVDDKFYSFIILDKLCCKKDDGKQLAYIEEKCKEKFTSPMLPAKIKIVKSLPRKKIPKRNLSAIVKMVKDM